jgi:hypothetical protein
MYLIGYNMNIYGVCSEGGADMRRMCGDSKSSYEEYGKESQVYDVVYGIITQPSDLTIPCQFRRMI